MRNLQVDNRVAVAVPVERGVSGRISIDGLWRVLLAMVFFVLPTCALAGPLTGTYKITSVAENGSDLHFSAQLNLVNPGDVSVTVTSIGVHSLAAPGHVLYTQTNVVLGPHSSASTSVSFVIPKRDFEFWSAAPHQLFTVKQQSAGGTASLESVALMRTKE